VSDLSVRPYSVMKDIKKSSQTIGVRRMSEVEMPFELWADFLVYFTKFQNNVRWWLCVCYK